MYFSGSLNFRRSCFFQNFILQIGWSILRSGILILKKFIQTEVTLLHMLQKMDHFIRIHGSVLEFL